MKETYYFPHDYNATQDPKMMSVVSSCGISGVGMYWIIVEILHQQPDSKILKTNYEDYIDFYGKLDSENEQVLNKIKQVFITVGLFVEEGDYIYSERVLKNKKERERLSELRSLAGQKSAQVRQKSTSVEQVLNKGQQGKERKGKEKEIKDITIQQPKSAGAKKIMDLFYTINPTMKFANTTYWKSAQSLIDKLGEEKAIKSAEASIAVYGQPYAPTITNPYQLETKLSELVAFYKKQQTGVIITDPNL